VAAYTEIQKQPDIEAISGKRHIIEKSKKSVDFNKIEKIG